jgi:hypothetical protein
MRCFTRLLLFICLAFSWSNLQAQKNVENLITGNFQNLTLREFTEQIEKQTNYFFYYDASLFDSLRISISVDKEPLGPVLEKAFEKTDFNYSIGPDDKVFLTKLAVVQTNLTAMPDDKVKTRTTGQEAATDKTANSSADVQTAVLENKLYLVGTNAVNNGQPNALVSGYVRDAKTGEPLGGVSIYIERPHIGVSSDQYGYYAISLPKGRLVLNIQSIGMKDTRRQIVLAGDGKINIDLQSQVMMLKNVVVSAEKMNNIRSVQMGVQKLDIKTLKQVPVVFGETDLLRVLLTLPGVKSVGEASTGLNVRGGSADQNLILFNDATIYNPSHFLVSFQRSIRTS